MRNDVKQLETEITKLINELSSMKVDDEQYGTVVDRIQSLQKLKLETERVDIDNIKIATQESNNKAMRELEQAKMELERQIKEVELNNNSTRLDIDRQYKEADLEISKAKLDNEANENKKNRLVNVIKTGAEIGLSVGTAALYYSMYKKGLKFEETGTFCSTMVKNHLSKFKLRK